MRPRSVTLEDAIILLQRYLDPFHETACDWNIWGNSPCSQCTKAEEKLRADTFKFVWEYQALKRTHSKKE